MRNTKNEMIFTLHFHQPFGNFDNVIETAFRRSYRPMIDILRKNPDVKTVIHFSGPLLIWLSRNHPEYIKTIRDLYISKQIELLGGTYAESVLYMSDDEEKIMQLEKYKELTHSIFDLNINLEGFWLTERIWTPEILPFIENAGYKYVFLDDEHIHKGGQTPGAFLYRHTYKDSSLLVIPVSKYLRYNLPFRSTQEIVDHIKEKKFCVHADDGEKFGDWPGMYEFLFEKEQYMKDFFSKCHEENIDFIFPEEYISKQKNIKEIFIPYSSYDGMNKWSMFTNEIMEISKKFPEDVIEKCSWLFYTGNFSNFFIKYPESRKIHQKNRLFCKIFRHLEDVYDSLLESQCCCGYWHGVFGGIYLPHLRDAIHAGNINAERKLPEGICIFDNFTFIKNDFLCISLDKKGGSVDSIDIFDKNINILNSFSRKPEFYHSEYNGETFYDICERNSFSDHITAGLLDCESYIKRSFGEQTDIFLEDYNIDEEKSCENSSLGLNGHSTLFNGNKISDIDIRKTFKISGNTVRCDYSWNISHEISGGLYFCVEINFHNIFGNTRQTLDNGVFSLESENNIRLEIKCDNAQRTILVPVNTLSRNHQEYDEIQQCYCAVIQIPLMESGTVITINIS